MWCVQGGGGWRGSAKGFGHWGSQPEGKGKALVGAKGTLDQG